jgi:hypothetical protein
MGRVLSMAGTLGILVALAAGAIIYHLMLHPPLPKPEHFDKDGNLKPKHSGDYNADGNDY